jgi:hypothetical protein
MIIKFLSNIKGKKFHLYKFFHTLSHTLHILHINLKVSPYYNVPHKKCGHGNGGGSCNGCVGWAVCVCCVCCVGYVGCVAASAVLLRWVRRLHWLRWVRRLRQLYRLRRKGMAMFCVWLCQKGQY